MSGASQYDQWLADAVTPEFDPEFDPEFHAAPAPEPDPAQARANRDKARAEMEAEKFAQAVASERRYREARRAVDREEAESSWTPPPELGSLREQLAAPREQRTFRIEKLMPTGSNVVLTAQYKAGKTTTVNHLVRCLVDGEPFLGRYPVRKVERRIAYFNYEMSEPQYLDWMAEVGITADDRVEPMHLRGRRMPLMVPRVTEWVIDWLKRHQIDVWVLDPLARAVLGSCEENDNTGMAAFTDLIDVIKHDAGVAEVVIPVHTGRAEQQPGQERARGATRIDDWPDVRWILTRDKDGRRFLRADGRDVDESEQMLSYEPTTRALTVAGGARAVVRHSDMRTKILGFVGLNPGVTKTHVHAAIGGRKTEVFDEISAMVRGAWLDQRDGERNAKLLYIRESPESHEPPWMRPDPSVGLF